MSHAAGFVAGTLKSIQMICPQGINEEGLDDAVAYMDVLSQYVMAKVVEDMKG